MDQKLEIKKKGKPLQSFLTFINNGKQLTYKPVLIGLIFGITFGFIDNLGLWIGLDKLARYLPGGIKTKAALGNTYSDGLGALLGTFIAVIVKDVISVDIDDNKDPLWINPIGIIFGCLLGIVVGNLIYKDK